MIVYYMFMSISMYIYTYHFRAEPCKSEEK